MEKEKFELRTDWQTMPKDELIVYVTGLHEYITEFDASSIKRMIVSMDNIAYKIAEDIDLIAEGNDGEDVYNEDLEMNVWQSRLKILNDSKDSKTFDRLMVLAGKIESFKKVSDMAEAIRPTIVNKAEEAKKEKVSVIEAGTGFEAISEQILNKNKKK